MTFLGFGLDIGHKCEGSKVTLYPRLDTPLFFVRLKAREFEFVEFSRPFCISWLHLTCPIVVQAPKGNAYFYGVWEGMGSIFFRPFERKLESIKRSYSELRRVET